jgi:hypothetical protein
MKNENLVRHNWPAVRDAYVNESPKPTYADLSVRFNVPVGTISRVCSDEAWPDLRAARLAVVSQTSGTLELIATAAKNESAASSLAFEAATAALGSIVGALRDLESQSDLKPRARLDMLQTATFALLNAANACDRFGIIGLPKALKRAAQDSGDTPRNQDWSPKLLAQLNVTVQTLQAAATKQDAALASDQPAITVDASSNELHDKTP